MNKMAALVESLKKEGLDAIFLTKQANQRYLEGFTGGDCFLLASEKLNALVADSRYTEMAESECRTAKIFPHRAPNHPPLAEVVAKIAGDNGMKKIGFEKERMTWELHDEISKELAKIGASLVPTSMTVEKIRAIKTAEEAALITGACRIADRALSDLLPEIRPGVSELDIRIELDYLLQKGGAEEPSFDTMVLFGARASQPHAVSRGDVRLGEGDFILIDYGACWHGYRSDTTRTFVCGNASDEQVRAYDAVLRSQLAAIELVKPGAGAKELNDAALDIIKAAGFPGFEYGIGHGVGLEIHEEPWVRQRGDAVLAPGMITTIEPGTYKPGWGGIRIEDTILVTDDGHRILTAFPKDSLLSL